MLTLYPLCLQDTLISGHYRPTGTADSPDQSVPNNLSMCNLVGMVLRLGAKIINSFQSHEQMSFITQNINNGAEFKLRAVPPSSIR